MTVESARRAKLDAGKAGVAPAAPSGDEDAGAAPAAPSGDEELAKQLQKEEQIEADYAVAVELAGGVKVEQDEPSEIDELSDSDMEVDATGADADDEGDGEKPDIVVTPMLDGKAALDLESGAPITACGTVPDHELAQRAV